MFEDVNWALVAAKYAILLFALTAHEAAHAWMATEAGDDLALRQGRLTMNPLPHVDPLGTVLLPLLSLASGITFFLFWAKPVPFREDRLKHSSYFMWIALAGPAANVILALWAVFAIKALALFGVTYSATPTFAVNASFSAWTLLTWFLLINVLLAAFNMIPVPPLDGSKVFYYIVVRNAPRLAKAWAFVEQYAFFILIALVFVRPIRESTIEPALNWVATQVFALAIA